LIGHLYLQLDFGTCLEDLCYIISIQGFIISLGLQLKNHRDIVSQIADKLGSVDKAQQYLNKCLYYVNIGSNDYINNYFLPQYYPTSLMYSPEQYAEALIQELSLNLLVYPCVSLNNFDNKNNSSI
jgi:hypothetical protein